MSRRLICVLVLVCASASADPPPVVDVEPQPLGANVLRVLDALDFVGAPLPREAADRVRDAARRRDAAAIQQLLDPHVLLVVRVNPESRVKVQRGPAGAVLQQGAYTPVLVKVINESVSTAPLRISSPQAGPSYAGVAQLSMERQDQRKLRQNENTAGADRFLELEMFHSPPMIDALSGLGVEYAIATIYSTESGKREATIGFDLGGGTQDLGFRGEVPVLFAVRPAVPVKLSVRDDDGRATTARLVFRDSGGHVYPAQARRLAPDLFFQEQVYRADGQTVLLPPGEFTMESSRGPEYVVRREKVSIAADRQNAIEVKLQRWVNPAKFGFYSGDHHVHAAGCAHYTSPTEGTTPEQVFPQVKGEGLNVAAVLNWAPCFMYQRRFFSPGADGLSEPLTVMKYDIEVSGFGSQALGHVCLLNLREQTYPGSEGTITQGWPHWTTPLMRWARSQGAVTGYPHSASGMAIDPGKAAARVMIAGDKDHDGRLSRAEAAGVLLPEAFDAIDADGDGRIDAVELERSHDRAADELPNFAIPEMNGVGAMECCVTTAEGVCDFISAMDTARIQEWNTWYHLMNCGYPLKCAGETDFPCMSGTRVGQGRTYVRLGKVERVDFAGWCEGLRAGRSYVSDGYAHALRFSVNGAEAGQSISLDGAGQVRVEATVAFAAEMPAAVPYGTGDPPRRKRDVGDTVVLHGPRPTANVEGGERLVEVVVNGRAIASRAVPADGKAHDLRFDVSVERSSWIALRQFPQLHSNPVGVLVAGRPVRASRRSALWCAGTIEQLWRQREKRIPPGERGEAKATFDRAIETYRRLAREAVAD